MRGAGAAGVGRFALAHSLIYFATSRTTMAANGNNMNDNSKPVVVITGCSAPGIGFETAKESVPLGNLIL